MRFLNFLRVCTPLQLTTGILRPLSMLRHPLASRRCPFAFSTPPITYSPYEDRCAFKSVATPSPPHHLASRRLASPPPLPRLPTATFIKHLHHTQRVRKSNRRAARGEKAAPREEEAARRSVGRGCASGGGGRMLRRPDLPRRREEEAADTGLRPAY